MASLINEAAASSSSSSLPNYRRHVFLSFRGEDTRYGFTDHLYKALRNRGIETFRDADELRRGEEIAPSLLKAIEESRVSIVVFSQNYASSRWCLDELVKILECSKSKGQEVKPVFYKVDPSHVRHQNGAFGDAFLKLEGRYKDRVGKWKEALTEAANLSGWHLEDKEYETEFIKRIVRELSAQLNLSCDLHVAEHQIGLKSCIQDVNSLLNIVEYMVGIWGPGGIGKSTIAKAVFNSIRNEFDGSCFLEEVTSNSKDLAKLARLQEILLFDILGDSDLKVHSVDKGVGLIRTRMQNKKVLLILDDVIDYSQLQKLVPPPECVRPGSRILITTRDKGWLANSVRVYEVKMLNDDQALELFCLHAFKSNEPPDDCLELARRAVHYAGGIPLALTVLGSHLSLINRDMWEATLDSCQGDPHLKIRNILKVSYDTLGVDLQGCFLDIACFFKGGYVDRVKPILEACYDLKLESGIPQLQRKALIRIDEKDNWMSGKIWMHDLIEEMGKDIVHQQSRDEPGERSRVWSEEDVKDVLTYNRGTNKVVGIQAPWGLSSISLNAKSFSEMKKLRYISISRMMKDESFSGDIDYLSDQLRWLDWPKCPLQCFPSNFHAKKLVNLNISGSCRITRLWERRKNFPRLTCMNLSGCESLEELPDLSGIPNLKELYLSWCISLVEVPDSIRFLHNLVTLNLRSCESLKELPDLSGIPNLKELDLSKCISLVEVPDSIRFLHNLVTLNLRGCKSLKELPDLSGIPNLKELDLSWCISLVEVPDSIRFLHNLVTLNLSGCESLEELPDLSGIPNLKELYLSWCISLVEVPDSIRFLHNLVTLNLSGCESLEELPDLSGIPNLKELYLSWCISLVEVPDSIRFLHNLVTLNLSGCESLEELPDLSGIPNLKELYLSWCISLVEVPDSIRFLHNLDTLNLSGCESLKELPDLSGIPNLKELDLSECTGLVEVPDSIRFLHNLESLEAIGCSKLAAFPKIPMKLDSLIELFLSGSDIRELDESIENLIGLKHLDLTECKNLTTLPCSIYDLQNLGFLDLGECSKLVRFPTNTKSLNVDGCSLPLPKLHTFSIAGCSLLSDCDFLMTLDCWETLDWLNLSRNNFVSLPACLTKFVNLRTLQLMGCKRLREIPELPPNVDPYIRGCELLEERFSTLTNRGAVIEAASPSIEEPTPSSWRLSLSSETPKRHRSAEEPSPAELSWLSLSTEPTPVNPPKRQRTAAGGQASMVHFAYEMAISPVPMSPDLHSAHHSTTPPQLQHQEEPTDLLRLSLNSSEPTKPRGPVKGDQDQWLSLSVLPSTSEL